MNRSLIPYGMLALIIFLLDRLSKWYVLQHVQAPVKINQLLTFELAFNRGISWGMFHSQNMYIFSLVTIAISLVTFLIAISAYGRWMNGHAIWGETFVLIGSFSNLLDRALYSGVVDFILLHYKDWHWPLFNVADMAIVCGVGLMLWEYYRS